MGPFKSERDLGGGASLRTMALDVGEKRIGVALSDPSGVLALPLTTIAGVPDGDKIDEVLRLAAENEVHEIIVGMPLSLSGRMGPQARRVTGFVEELSGRGAVPVRTVDERFSTVEAERGMRQAGVEPSRERARVDAAAAAVILQSYLDSKTRG